MIWFSIIWTIYFHLKYRYYTAAGLVLVSDITLKVLSTSWLFVSSLKINFEVKVWNRMKFFPIIEFPPVQNRIILGRHLLRKLFWIMVEVNILNWWMFYRLLKLASKLRVAYELMGWLNEMCDVPAALLLYTFFVMSAFMKVKTKNSLIHVWWVN